MLLAPKQASWFWRDWAAVCRLNEWDKAQSEIERKAYLRSCGFDSLTEVDRVSGFDCVMSGLAAILQPDNLELQLHFQGNKRTTLYFAIKKLAHKISPAEVKSSAFESPYAQSIMVDKFQGRIDPNDLSLEELEQFRATLADHLVREHRPETLTRRRGQARARRADHQKQPEPERENCPF